MTKAEEILNDFSQLASVCKKAENDNYITSESAEVHGQQRLSDSLFGESMAYCRMAHKMEELIADWKKTLKEEEDG